MRNIFSKPQFKKMMLVSFFNLVEKLSHCVMLAFFKKPIKAFTAISGFLGAFTSALLFEFDGANT